MEIKVYNSFNKELESLWSSFELAANSIAFQSYAWQHYWNEKVGQPNYAIDLCIVVCFSDGEVQAIFPFGIRRALGARVLEFLGVGEADYSAPLIGVKLCAEQFREIWAAVLEAVPMHDVVHFKNMPQIIGNSNIVIDKDT